MTPPLVHVLVINWNGLEHLEACYASLLEAPYENARFVLVDNASSDESIAYVRGTFGHDPRVEVLALDANRGWSGGNNAGITRALEAGADYVFLLNNDTATAPHSLGALTAYMEAEPGIGACAPKMLLYDNPGILNSTGLECSVIGATWDRGLGRVDSPRWNRIEPVIGVCGGAAFFRAEAIRKAGLLPEDFEIYLDDLDLCLRVWMAGYRITSFTEASVRHKFSATMGAGARMRRKYFLNTRNRMRLMRRNFPRDARREALAAMLRGECRAVGRALLDGEPWRARAHLRAWGDAITYTPSANGHPPKLKADTPFWKLIKHEPLFFPGVPLPDPSGWYAIESIGGRDAKPFARRATLTLERPMRMRSCVPAGVDFVPEISLYKGGEEQARLGPSQGADSIYAPAGEWECCAHTIWEAETSRRTHDIGGWIALEPAEAERAVLP